MAAVSNQNWKVKEEMSEQEEQYVGFIVPMKLLQAFDEVIKGTYAHRTDALRDAMRDLIRKLEEEKRVKEEAKLGTRL